MNQNKSTQIKQAIAKIDLDKIANYPEHPQSRTLRRIIRYSQRIKASNNDQEIFKLGARIAYYLDVVCDPNKANYVKDEKEKKHWLYYRFLILELLEIFAWFQGDKHKFLNKLL